MTHDSAFLRPARKQDAMRLARLHRAARARAMPWLRRPGAPEDDLDFFETVVLATCRVTVAEIAGTPAGFIALSDGHIEHLYVAPDHWRRGIGSRLVALAKARELSLELWTFRRNSAARAFYAYHGFREADPGHGRGNQEAQPDIRLVWSSDQP
jgi:putative acetyltransferase